MQTEIVQETQYISRKEAAKIVGVSVRTIDYWIRGGKLRSVKFGDSRGSTVRIHKADFAEFLQSRGKR